MPVTAVDALLLALRHVVAGSTEELPAIGKVQKNQRVTKNWAGKNIKRCCRLLLHKYVTRVVGHEVKMFDQVYKTV